MEIFIGNKRLLRILGIIRFEHRNATIEWIISIIQYIIFFCCAPFFFLSPLYFFLYRAETFYEKTFAFCIVNVLFCKAVAYNIMVLKRKQILELYAQFESKIRERERYGMIDSYVVANEMIEKWTNRAFNLVNMTMPLYFFPLMIASHYRYYVLDLAEESFYMIYPTSVPYFNEKTPIGYMFISLFNIALIYYIITILECVLVIYYGFCVLLMTYSVDIKRNLEKIENKIKSSLIQSGKLSNTTKIEIKKDVYEIIQFHADAKHLVHQCAETYDESVTVQFALSASLTCAFLLQIQNGIKTHDKLIFYQGCFGASAWLLSSLILCNFGQMVTNHYADLCDSIYEISLHECTSEVQNAFKMMIRIAQQPVYFEGFAGYQCTRETFTKIANAAYRFFMLLRRFN